MSNMQKQSHIVFLFALNVFVAHTGIAQSPIKICFDKPSTYFVGADKLSEEELVWVHNQKYKLHKNGLFYDIVNDREERSPIPREKFTDEQAAMYQVFKRLLHPCR